MAVGRRRRTVDPAMRTLIEARDQGCRVPWCTRTVGIEVHHVVHVEDGGETDPRNLMGLCSCDHDLHHRGLLGIAGDPTRPDGLVFTDRWGRRIDRAPPVPPRQSPGEAASRLGVDARPFVPPSGEVWDGRWFAWA